MTSAVLETGTTVAAQMRAHLTACTPLFNTLDRLSKEPDAFADGTLAAEVENLLADLAALTAMLLVIRHLGHVATGKPSDRERIGPYVSMVTLRAANHLSAARARLDALMLEADNLAGLGIEEIRTKKERRRTGGLVAVQAVKVLREMRFVEQDLDELRIALEESGSRDMRGYKQRIARLRLVNS